jgi:RHS repeat-associated protein
MTQYQFNINGQSDTGVLTWNANSTLQKLVITDALANTTDSQTCTYGYDDVVRIASANCGTAANQTFSYDPFGNIDKSGSPYQFLPNYSSSTNHITTVGGVTATYDSNGNVTNDGVHTYTWDADGNSITLDGTGLTFDAFDRAVEKNVSGTFTEIMYAPTGAKLALMSGQTLQKAFISLPGKASAVYTGSGLDHYRHSDWLGSVRLTSSTSRSVLSTAAYAPLGETYAQSGTADVSFTGQNQDTVGGDYDFMYREYSTQGRWPSPDPAGLAAVNPMAPQSWNRYAYVLNNPLGFTDPLGLDCKRSDGTTAYFGESEEGSSVAACEAAGGTWINGSSCITSTGAVGICTVTNGTTANDPGKPPCQYDVQGCGDTPSWTLVFLQSFFTTNPFPAAWRSFGEGGCNRILLETLASDLSPVPLEPNPGLGEAVEATPKVVAAAGVARASLYSVSRGLVSPLKSGTYRGLVGEAINASRTVEEAAPALTIAGATVHAVVASGSAAWNGECH